MKLTVKLALSQIKINRNRSIMTLIGIALSSAMLTAVCGYVESAKQTIYRALGYDQDASLPIAVVAMGMVLGGIIVTASIIVVSNSFRVSADERTRQFGILKSVGATKKQIAGSVLYEAVFLSIIGIPIGIAVGILLELLGTYIITNLLNSMYSNGVLHVDSKEFLNMNFAVSPIMFFVATITSFGTVLLSAWLPARKAAKIPAIEAIRNAGTVRLKTKNVRVSRLTESLLGYEGVLAAKSLKRSRRNFRATIISLTISIVMLITAGSFGLLMLSTTNLIFPNIDATAVAEWASELKSERKNKKSGIDFIMLDSNSAETITSKLRDYKNADIYGVGKIRGCTTTLPDGKKITGELLSVDEKHYKQLCKDAGVPVGSNLLVNLHRKTVKGKKKEYVPYRFSEFAGKTLTFSSAVIKPIEVTITGELTGEYVTNEITYMCNSDLAIIVPDCETMTYSWFANVADVAGFTVYAKQALKEHAPQSKKGIEVFADCMDVENLTNQVKDLVNTIMFFVYGFIGMLTLIAITSVISTISTNIRTRSREFAVLKSVGMTSSGIKKMLNLESVLCSIRALAFGIPLGLIGAYTLYIGLELSIELPFRFPWLLIAECILGVFTITWITMRHVASKLENKNIVETIRGE